MLFYANLFIQLAGSITLYLWFFSNGKFFYFLNKYKNSNPIFLFTMLFGFIGYPAILALCYKLSWDYYYENYYLSAFLYTLFPVICFLIGFKVYMVLDHKR